MFAFGRKWLGKVQYPIAKIFEDHKEQNSQQEQQIPQHENRFRELEQLLRQKEFKIRQDEGQRLQQVNELQETLCEVRRELQQQISRFYILLLIMQPVIHTLLRKPLKNK